jgi:hypothetical protein
MTAAAVDAYIAALPPDQAQTLTNLRAVPAGLVHQIITLRLGQLALGT